MRDRIFRNRSGRLAVAAAGVALVASCLACGAPSAEDRLRRMIEAGRQAVEDKDFDTLGGLVSETYSDSGGRDRRALLGGLRALALERGQVHTLVREEALSIPAPGRGEASFVVAVASTPIESPARFDTASANFLRVDLTFADEDGTWRLTGSAWRWAEPSDLF
jgi:hypothetical protein